jgi:hypothetical protein
MKRFRWLIVSAALVLTLQGGAAWNSIKLADGSYGCKDSESGAIVSGSDLPYKAQSDVTKSCKTLTSFMPWLYHSAQAAVIRTHTIVNSDGTHDTRYPADTKPGGSSTLTFDATACAAALAIIANQNTGTPTSINIDSACLTGTSASSSTLTIDVSASAANWSITGSYPNRALTHAGSIAGSGTMVLHATAGGLSATSNSYSWTYTSQALAAPWTQGDVGSPAAGNNATSTGGVLTDVCKGDTGSTADTGHFVRQPLSGDFEMIGPMPTITAATVWALHAPSVRQSPTLTGSKYAALFIYGTGRFAFNWRTATDGSNGAVAETTWSSSQSWRITRVGNVFTGYVGPSSSGPWTLNGSQTVTMSDPVYAGDLCGNGLDANPATIVSTLPTINALGGGSAGSVAFSTSVYGPVNENGSPVTISVPRTGGSTGAGSAVVSLAGTSNAFIGTDATTGCSFPCTLNWANGDAASKTITITPINRAGSQASRHFDFVLGNASGVTIGGSSTASLTINDVSASAAHKWRPGIYGECIQEMPHSIDGWISLGNPEYLALKSCIDFWSSQSVVKGIVVMPFWSTFEGDTPGSYDGSVGNGLDGPGKIGFPLWDDILAYAASKNTHIIIAFAWFTGGNGGCGQSGYLGIKGFVPRYLLQSSCSTGTDTMGTYGVSPPAAPFGAGCDTCQQYVSLWKAATMDRFIAMMNAYGDRYDNNRALEGWILMAEEGDYAWGEPVGNPSVAALDTQWARLAGIKSHWTHTNITLACEWCSTAPLLAAFNAPPTAIGYMQNDVYPNATFSGTVGYTGYTGSCGGGGNPCWGNTSTHDYRSELPADLWMLDEVCGQASLGRTAPFYTPQEFYDAIFTTGTSDGGRPVKPNHFIIGRVQAMQFCPGSANQQWGTPSSGGQNQFYQTHTVNTNCPSQYAACDTTP